MDAEIMGEVTRKMLADAAGDESVLTEAQRVERRNIVRREGLPARDFILWGKRHDHAGGVWIKISGGTLAAVNPERNRRERVGWECRILVAGEHPEHN